MLTFEQNIGSEYGLTLFFNATDIVLKHFCASYFKRKNSLALYFYCKIGCWFVWTDTAIKKPVIRLDFISIAPKPFSIAFIKISINKKTQWACNMWFN